MSLSRATSESTVLRAIRRAAIGSVIGRAIAAGLRWPKAAQWIRETRRRFVVGMGGEWSPAEEQRTVDQMGALVAGSRIATGVGWVVTKAVAAWQASRTRRLLQRAVGSDLEETIRAAGVALIVAVVTHTVLMALLGAPVYRLGWSTRLLLLVIGGFSLTHPRAIAAAVRDRRAR